MESGTPRLLQEILVGGAYAAAQKNLPSDAASLLPLLPLTVATPAIHQEIKVIILLLMFLLLLCIVYLLSHQCCLLSNVSFSIFQMNDSTLTLSQETLWNTAMMLLSPQQRLVPYRSDMWTRLYDSLSASQQRASATTCSADRRSGARFRPCHVADKLMVSLLCYQVTN